MSIEPGVEVPDAPRRGVLRIVLRIVIGTAVVAILVARTPDPDALVNALRTSNWRWMAAAAGVFLVGIVVSAFRWRAYLDALDMELPVTGAVRMYLVGTFFNAFLPSGIGGDAYKAVRIGRARGTYTDAFASVFLDRFAGFVGLAVIGLVGVLVELILQEGERVAAVAAVLVAAMLGGAALVVFGGERVLGGGRLIPRAGVGEKLRSGARAIHAAARHPRAAARGYLLGLAFQGLVVAYHLAVARALGLEGISVAAMTAIVVIASLATLIPLSPGGLGFREAAYVWALGTFGIAHGTALAFALLVLAVLLITSAIGGLVYVTAGGDVPRNASLSR